MRILNIVQPGQPQCNSDRCNSGRAPCPTPHACQVPDPEDQPRKQSLPEGWFISAGVIGAALLAVLLAVHLVARNWPAISRWFA